MSRESLKIVAKDEKKRVLEWLSDDNYYYTCHKDLQRQITPGTATWIFNNSKYQGWEKNNFQLLICSGKRVSLSYQTDKSGNWEIFHHVRRLFVELTNRSVIIDRLVYRLDSESRMAVIQFYFNSSRDDYGADYVLKSLIMQLLKQLPGSTLPPDIKKAHKEHERLSQRKLETDDLWDYFRSSSRNFQRIFICIDAFDECPVRERQLLLSHIEKFMNLMDTNLSIIITTREHLTHTFEQLKSQKIVIDASDDDIKKFLHNGLIVDIVSDETRIDVINKIHKAAEGQ